MQIKKYSVTAFLLTFVFITGGYSLLLGINIYRNTLIIWTIPTIIWILSGVLITPLNLTLLRKYFRNSGITFHIFFNIVSFGSIISYLFMALNFYFPFNQENVYQVTITKTGKLPRLHRGCGKPYANVEVKGIDKKLVFPCGFEIANYSNIILTVKTGLLGFDVITKKTFPR